MILCEVTIILSKNKDKENDRLYWRIGKGLIRGVIADFFVLDIYKKCEPIYEAKKQAPFDYDEKQSFYIYVHLLLHSKGIL